MKKAIFLGMAIFALSGCNSDDVNPQADEKYCASVKLSDNQYKIDKVKADYHREHLPLADEYCENYNKYVFNNIESAEDKDILTYDAPFLVSEFDDVFYTVGYSLEGESAEDIKALILSSDFNVDNLDARLKLLINQSYLFPSRIEYAYYDLSLNDLVTMCNTTGVDCLGIDFETIDIEIILRNLVQILKLLETLKVLEPTQTFDSIEDAVAFDQHFSTSLNSEELTDLYMNKIQF